MRKHTYLAAASGIVIAVALTGPAALAEQDQQGMQGSQQSQSTSGSQQQGNMISKQADDIAGAKVVNRNGDDIGEVDEIVRSNDDNKPYAVISAGGWFDIGDKDIVVPLDQLKMQNGLVVVPDSAATEEQLKNRPAYDESRFSEVSDDTQVQIERSDFAALEGRGAGTGSTGTYRQHPQDQSGQGSQSGTGSY